MEGEAASGVADQLDLEAAEQLIQLSGADDGTSEGRSADSVKFCGPDQAGMKEVDKDEVAVESRRRRSDGRSPSGKDGDGGEKAGKPDKKSAKGVNRRSRVPGTEEKGDKEEEPAVDSRTRGAASARFLAVKDGAGVVVDDGEERKRLRFRWLSDIYRETRQMQLATRDWEHRRAAGGNVPPVADERRKRRRAADAEAEVVVVPMVSKARTMVHRHRLLDHAWRS